MTKIAKVSLLGSVQEAIQQACDEHEEMGFYLRGTVMDSETSSVLLVFHGKNEPTSTSQGAS
jgi:hypothetical protein